MYFLFIARWFLFKCSIFDFLNGFELSYIRRSFKNKVVGLTKCRFAFRHFSRICPALFGSDRPNFPMCILRCHFAKCNVLFVLLPGRRPLLNRLFQFILRCFIFKCSIFVFDMIFRCPTLWALLYTWFFSLLRFVDYRFVIVFQKSPRTVWIGKYQTLQFAQLHGCHFATCFVQYLFDWAGGRCCTFISFYISIMPFHMFDFRCLKWIWFSQYWGIFSPHFRFTIFRFAFRHFL